MKVIVEWARLKKACNRPGQCFCLFVADHRDDRECRPEYCPLLKDNFDRDTITSMDNQGMRYFEK